ncbi:MAG: signal recognition particle protein [Legionellales bacterium]|nr:signal recognition particle protein [Legionellales bacterium]
MFNHLSERLSQPLNSLRGNKKLTESNIKETLQTVRKALLEADVALPVVKQFITDIEAKALGQTTTTQIKAGDAFVKIVSDELTSLLGESHSELSLNAQPPVVILMAGLQGSGKTTTAAKLAKHLQDKEQKKVMLTSADIYRPAAIDQLETLSQQINAEFFPSNPKQSPKAIVKGALKQAKQQFADVLIIDTAGRLHIDDTLMEELKDISKLSQPTETLLVVDSMTGQDAANIAKTFNDTLELTGVILTKADGDARGGAALSMRMITGKPIKFLGVGEKIDALEAFHPERMASRILGMGDIVSLVEEAESKVDKKEADKLAKKLQKGKRFDFNDFLAQLAQMKKMGGMQSMMGKLPGMGKMPQAAKDMMDDKLLNKMEAIIQSMTPQERSFPAVLNGSRKKRIAAGSGTTLQDINKLSKQFTQMQKMIKRFKGNKMQKRLKQLEGQLPPDMIDKLPPMG